jgi:hypothetical protein
MTSERVMTDQRGATKLGCPAPAPAGGRTYWAEIGGSRPVFGRRRASKHAAGRMPPADGAKRKPRPETEINALM